MPDLALTAAGRLNGTDQRQRLHAAARAFEQQFIAQLLKPMSERSEEADELFGRDPAAEPFQGLFVDGLSEHAAGGLGIAEILEQAIAGRVRHGR